MKTRWKKIQEIFWQALKLKANEREEFIANECDDKRMREEVYSLLKAHKQESVLDIPIDSIRESVFIQADNRNLIGEVIGRYEILSQIGTGGMGTVFLAKRADGEYEQKVALKLLKGYITSEEQKTRFRLERQILASLQHENIARLFDGGVTSTGQPWFVMEYIDGLSITDHCDKNRLNIRERIELFLNVCSAVRYAHQKLIVHRDLKPSNILVTSEGQVKLVDFGIARMLNDEQASDRTSATESIIPLTPAYASPEQLRMESISTSSDQYQLGVILYELLTGFRPYQIEGYSISRVEEIVCMTDPAQPSALLNQENFKSEANTVLKCRATDSKQYAKELRGDLDYILLKALRKEPEDRYQSAEQMADDLKRFLNQEPVIAHPASKWYKTAKFLKRHTIESAAAGITIVLVVIYLFTLTWHSAQTQAALEQAKIEAEKSEQVVAFLVRMFESGDPYENYGDSLRASELLEQGEENAEKLQNQPEVQAHIYDVIGRVYQSLGEFEQSANVLGKSVELRKNNNLGNSITLADSYYHLASSKHHIGDYSEADELFNIALDIYRNNPNHLSVEYANTLYLAAKIKTIRGEPSEAISMHKNSLGMRKDLLGESHRDVASGYHALGETYLYAGQPVRSLEYLDKAFDLYSELFGSNHPHLAGVHETMARSYQDLDNYDDAEQHLKRALSIRKSVLGEDHVETGISRKSLADYYRKRRNFEKAEEIYLELLDGMNDPNPLRRPVVQAMAELYTQKELHELAEPYYRQTVELLKSTLSSTHPRLLKSELRLGKNLLALNKFEESESILVKLIDKLENLNDDNYSEILNQSVAAMVELYESTGQHDLAHTIADEID